MEVKNLEEKINLLEDRIAKLEKIEKRRKNIKWFKIISVIIVIIIGIILLWIGYNNYIKPYKNTIIELQKQIDIFKDSNISFDQIFSKDIFNSINKN